MILDKQIEFSDSQVVTTSAVSTNVYDQAPLTRNTSRDWGSGSNAYLVLQTDAAATAAGAATVTVTLETADNAAMTGSTVVATYGPFSIAQMAAGQTISVAGLPYAPMRRYVALRYTVGNGPLTGGSFSAFVTINPEVYSTYDRNYNT